MADDSKKIGNRIQRFITMLEKDRTTVVTAFLLVLLYGLIRAVVEIFLLADKNTYTGSIYLSSLHNWAHVLAFFTGVFLTGTLVISLLAKVKIRKAVNVVLLGFWIIIIPPLLDYFIFGVRSIEAYHYAPIEDIGSNIPSFFLAYSTTWGLRIQGFIIAGLAVFYVAYRSRSAMRTILAIPALICVIVLFGSLNFISVTGELFIPPGEVLNPAGEVTKPFVGPQLFMVEMLFVISAFLVIIYVDRSNKKIFPYLLDRVKPQFVLYPLVIVGAGLFLARPLDITNANDFTVIVLVILITVFGWLFASILKLFYEPEKGKKKGRKKRKKHTVLTKSQLKHSAVVLAIVTLSLSFLSGFIPLLLCAACMLLLWLYCLPSFRFKNIIQKAIIFGLCSFLAFLIGYFSVTHFNRFVFGAYEIWYPATRTVLDMNTAIVGAVVFVAGIMVSIFYPRSSKLVLGAVVFIGIVATFTIFVISPIFKDFFTESWPFILANFLWIFLLSIILISFMVHMIDRKILPSLWRNLRPFRTLHFILMVCIGLVVANNIDLFDANNVPYIIIAVFLLIFLWQYTIMVNDVYDQKIDELSNIDRPLIAGVLTRSQYTKLIVLMALFSAVFSFLLGPMIFSLALGYIFLGTIYSVPPIRVRDRIWSSCIIGLGSAFAFLIGYFTPNFEGVIADLTPNAILISFMIFSALSLAPILTDLKDYEGDKRAGVKSIYTVFGLEKGKKMASTLIPILFLVPTLIFHSILDVVTFIIFGVIATMIFYKRGDFRGVFGCYFVVIIYCIMRFVEVLPLAM